MTTWTRMGAAFGNGVPAGAAFGVANSTSKDSEASDVGSAFRAASTPTLSGIQSTPNVFGVTPAQSDQYTASHANDLNTDVGSTLIGKGMAWADRYVWSPGSDAIEALMLSSDNATSQHGFFALNPFQDFGTEWKKARTGNNTPGQVRTQQIRAWFNPNATIQVPQIGKDGKVTGYKTEQNRYWDNEAKRWVYPLLDDPRQQLAQDEYFRTGIRRWVTGTTDFVISSVTDPTLVAGKVTKPIRAAREVFGAQEAENAFKAASWADGVEKTDDLAKVATVTGKSRRLQKQVSKTAQNIADTLVNGEGIAKYANDPLIAQTADSGAILSMAKRAADMGGSLEDIQKRVQNVIYAGAGSQGAYERLASESPLMGLEIDSVTSPNSLAARHDLYYQNIPHEQRLEIFNQDDQLNRLHDAMSGQISERIAHLTDQLQQRAAGIQYEADLERVKNVGTLGTGEFGGKGGISKIQTPGIFGQRVVTSKIKALGQKSVEHAYTQQVSPYLPPIHYFTGEHMPGYMHLDGVDAQSKFEAYLYSAAKYAKRSGDTDLMQVIKDNRDKFAMSRSGVYGDAGLARNTRYQATTAVQQAMRDHIVTKWSEATGLSKEEIGSQIDGLLERRDAEIKRAVNRARQAADANATLVLGDEEGLKAFPDALRDELNKANDVTGSSYVSANDLSRPISTSQFQRVVGLTDWNRLDRSLAALHKSGIFKPAVVAGRAVGHTSAMALDFLSDYWKFGVLFRPIAYLVRNQLDTQSRLEAELGSMTHGLMAAKGMKNFALNWKNIPRIDAAQYQMRLGLHSLVDQANDALVHENLGKAARKSWQDALTEANDWLTLDQDAFRQRMIDLHGGALPADLQGKVRLRSTPAKYIQGTRFRFSAGGQAIESAEGKMAVYNSLDDFMKNNDLMNAENTFMGYFSDNTAQALASARLRRLNTGEYMHLRYDPSRPQLAKRWTDAYLTYVNHQLRNDTVNRMIMSGQSDRDIMEWLRVGKGSEYWQAFQKSAKGADRYASPAELIQAKRNTLDKVLPTVKSRQYALSRDLTAEDVTPTFAETARPQIPAAARQEVFVDEPALKQLKGFRERYFNVFSSLPEGMMGRHPLYMTYFRQHISDAVDRFGKDGVDHLSLDQVHNIRRQADMLARKDVSRIVFDTTRKTPFQNATRWLFPFYGAWQDTMLKWARIQGDNPEAIPGLLHAFTVPSRFFQVQDDNGNIVRPNGDVMDPVTGKVVGTGFDPLQGHWVIPLPKAIQNWSGSQNLKVNRNSLNVIFQGEPFWLPGPGPIVTIGVNEIAQKVMPELFNVDPAQFMNNPITHWAAPFGLSNQSTAEQAMPSWFNTMYDLFAHDDNWKTHFNQQMYDITGQIARGDLPKMSQKEITDLASNRTRNWFYLRLLGTQSPVSTSPDNALDFYVNRYHAYLNTYGKEARDKFLEDYPEYGEATISTTVNATGINATIKAQSAADKYMSAIKSNPKYGWAIVGPDNLQGYDPNVYTEQKALGWRTLQDPQAALDQMNADKGWQTYNAFITKMNQAMVQNGVTSLRSADGAPYAQAKQQFIDDLSRKNPAWKNSFASAGAGDSQVQFLDAMNQTIKSYPNLAKREDFVQLQKYMAARSAMRKAMAQEGVHTLQTTTNPDGTPHYADSPGGILAQQWDAFYSDLYDKSSPVAKAMFDRARLIDDDLSNGVSN